MQDDADRSRPADARSGLVGRKDITDYSGGWAIAALVATGGLIAAVVTFFFATGPERTRTAEYSKSAGQHAQSGPRRPAARISNQDMPAAPRSP